MTIVWCVLSDLAIGLLFFIPIKYKVMLHIICGSIMFLFTFVGYFININYLSHYKHNKLFSHHKTLGIIILFWLIFQFTLGILSRTLQSISIHPSVQYIIRLMHKCSGYLLVILTQIQVLIGWIVKNQTIAIVLISLWLFSTILFIFLLNHLASKDKKKEVFT
jgi:hypothetical protein